MSNPNELEQNFIIIIIILFDSGSMAHKTQEHIHKTQKR